MSAVGSSAVLSNERATQLHGALQGLGSESLWWVSGYIAGLARGKQGAGIGTSIGTDFLAELAPEPTPVAPSSELPQITVLFGSQTGNAERVATALHAQLIVQHPQVQLLRADAYTLKQLKNERHLYLVISTQGDGDPPEDARAFYQQLLSARAPKLPDLQFHVLGLGDSSYPKFNVVAQTIDARLTELGATRIANVELADLDFESGAQRWQQASVQHAQALLPRHAKPSNVALLPLRVKSDSNKAPQAKTETWFDAAVLANQSITTARSPRQVHHLELNLDGSGIRYQPGDALLVQAKNPPTLIDQILAQQAWSANATLDLEGQSVTIKTALSGLREITRINKAAFGYIAEHSRNCALKRLLLPEQQVKLANYLQTVQLIDALNDADVQLPASALIPLLKALKPRAYSIASAQSVVGDEVHLTVAHVQYQLASQTQLRFGAASHALCGTELDASFQVRLEANNRFRLPQDSARDVIMIGPGTGVAPFRAFVQERAETGARGRNWLFFGNTHFRENFLYQLEWQRALKSGHLHALSVAFSRDSAEKIYVQQRIREQAKELYGWIESGAHIYVCGDATQMAKDVEAALLEVFISQGGLNLEDAQEKLIELTLNKRYQKDVY